MPVMPKELRDYQVEDVELLLSHKRFALWHEPGVGKTLPAMHAASHHKPILIACPGYIVPQWAEEIAEAFPHDTIVQCVGPTEARQVAALIPADWTIANLEMLRTPDTFVRPYQTLILDEVHHYRGRTSQQSKGAQTLADRIPNVYQLTGTPIKMRPMICSSRCKSLIRTSSSPISGSLMHIVKSPPMALRTK